VATDFSNTSLSCRDIRTRSKGSRYIFRFARSPVAIKVCFRFFDFSRSSHGGQVLFSYHTTCTCRGAGSFCDRAIVRHCHPPHNFPSWRGSSPDLRLLYGRLHSHTTCQGCHRSACVDMHHTTAHPSHDHRYRNPRLSRSPSRLQSSVLP